MAVRVCHAALEMAALMVLLLLLLLCLQHTFRMSVTLS
jgi:hypothetical protein